MPSSFPASILGKPWHPPAPEDLASELPQYEIIGLLGRGGMGAVYRARQKSLKRDVAIKVLPPTIEDNDMHFGERFRAEAESMARLNHPGIISVYDAGETPGGLLYIVMEYVEGTDVHEMIRASGRLPAEHAHAITAHVCDALAYAHANGLIHRDIKPANIMVDTQGRVKVADFGLAKMANDDSGFTQSNMAVGTPDFVAPEALIPGMPVDGRADLYAVGVMLYQMLTGNIPRGAWHPASVVVPGIDLRFDAIISKAMQMDRETRHSSATELRQHLDTLLMPAVPAPDLQRYSSAGMAKLAAPQGMTIARAGAAAAIPDGRAKVTPVPSPKSRTPLFIGIGAAAVIGLGGFVMFGGEKPTPVFKHQTLEALPTAPIKVVESPKPERKLIVAAKAPEPTKMAPTKPVAAVPKTEEASSLLVTSSKSGPLLQSEETPPAASPPPVPSAPNTVPVLTIAASPPSDGLKPVSALPPELATLDATFIRLQSERVTAPFETEVAKLNAGYLGGIGKKIADEKAAGHLDGILALEAEQKLMTEKQPVPESDDDKTPASLKALRVIYRTAYAKLAATRATNLKLLTEPLDKRLAQMESDFTKADRLADAKVVRRYRETMAERSPEFQPVIATRTISAPESPPAEGVKSGSMLVPAAALTMKDGITNTLGMKFLPVNGTNVLFCIHEVRYGDYSAYAAEAQGVDGTWKDQSADGYALTENKENHPVMKVSWEDAQKFCEWLSKKEGKTYRLPTDEEWSIAVGLGRGEKRPQGITPAMLSKKENTEFPWGGDYPPKTKDKSGNYNDASRKAKAFNDSVQYLEDYDDGFPTTAPVMSFKPNKLGIYDMGGNVWEWCEDWYDNAQKERVLRGGSWDYGDRSRLLSSYRSHLPPGNRSPNCFGFRVVLVVSGG